MKYADLMAEKILLLDKYTALRHERDALAARLAEAERLLDDAAEEFQLQHDPEDCIAMRNRILAFLRATASASAAQGEN
jgi:hypothetical protein